VADGGVYVSAETAQRLSCDSATIVMRHAADRAILDVGRKTRTIPPAIRRALTARDTRCQFPGCAGRRCDAHHIQHWADGGATRLENLVLLCRRHHRTVHEGGVSLFRAGDGSVVFIQPNGRRLDVVPASRVWDEREGTPQEPTIKRLAAAGTVLGPSTTTPCWDGGRFDVVWAIDVLRGREPLRIADQVSSGVMLARPNVSG
jgi:hypothetical protein